MADHPQVAKRAIDARRRLNSVLIANASRLDVPFTDRPEITPWTTHVKPARQQLSDAIDDLIRVVDAIEEYAEFCAKYASEDVLRADVAWKLRQIIAEEATA